MNNFAARSKTGEAGQVGRQPRRGKQLATMTAAALVAVLALTGMSSVPSSSDVTPDMVGSNGCLDNVASLAESTEYLEATDPAAHTTDYYSCLGSIVSVQTETDDGSKLEFAYDARTDETVDITGFTDDQKTDAVEEIAPASEADRASNITVPGGAATITTASYTADNDPAGTDSIDENSGTDAAGSSVPAFSTNRLINSSFKETLSFNMPYGIRKDGTPIDSAWIKNTVTLQLGTSKKSVGFTYSWTNMTNHPSVPSLGIFSYRQNGIASPTYEDGAWVGIAYPQSYMTSNTVKGTLGTESTYRHHVELDMFTINDFYYNHVFQFPGPILIGHRFECRNNVVCQFPGGKEAGL